MTKEAAAFEQASKALYHNLVTVVAGLATMDEKDSWAWIVDQNWPTHFEDYIKTLVAKRKAFLNENGPFSAARTVAASKLL
jgi:hypothetical protein